MAAADESRPDLRLRSQLLALSIPQQGSQPNYPLSPTLPHCPPFSTVRLFNPLTSFQQPPLLSSSDKQLPSTFSRASKIFAQTLQPQHLSQTTSRSSKQLSRCRSSSRLVSFPADRFPLPNFPFPHDCTFAGSCLATTQPSSRPCDGFSLGFITSAHFSFIC